MKALVMKTFAALFTMCAVFVLSSCQTGGVSGNEEGTAPANEIEAHDYQKAVNRCHRTGGTRVVKIMGELKCY